MIRKIKEQAMLAIDFVATAILGVAAGWLLASLIILGLIGHTIEKRMEKRNV
jgi:hypothetical protein